MTKLRGLEAAANELRAHAEKAIKVGQTAAVCQEETQRSLDEMRRYRSELRAARECLDTTVNIDKAILQDAETLLVYTRFLIGILEGRNPKEGNRVT